MHKRQSKLEKAATYVALTLVTLFFLLPLFWILRTSMITKVEAYKMPPNWMAAWTFDNYIAIFSILIGAVFDLNETR